MSEDADSITSLSFQATLCLPPSSPYLPTLSARLLWEIRAGGNRIYISHFIWIFLMWGTRSQHLRGSIPSCAAQSTPHTSHLLHSQLWCPGSPRCPSTELPSSCSSPAPQTNPSQSQGFCQPPRGIAQCPCQHIQLGIQSKPMTRYSIFSMICRAAAKVGGSELVPTLSSLVPALGTWRPVLTPLQQHPPAENHFWRPVRVLEMGRQSVLIKTNT